MIEIFESTNVIRQSLELSLPQVLGDDAEIIVANVDQFNAVEEFIKEGKSVIFYGFSSEASLRLSGCTAVPYFYFSYTGYVQIPATLDNIANLYVSIRDGKKIQNSAAILAGQVGFRNNLIGTLLHDMCPGKDAEEPLERAAKEFGVTGTVKHVQEQLEKMQNEKDEKTTPVKDLSLRGSGHISGILCDIEGTLLIKDGTAINEKVLYMLNEKGKEKAVSLWTGGDVKKLEKKLFDLKVTEFPVLSKYIFRGCEIEEAIDDLPREEFEEKYGIKTKIYVQV